MRCPTISELPPPPEGKSGWPWTEETPQLPDQMPDGRPWPRISIVTPSYNQGQFIEETIRSVLLQGYPDLEYIIIDGGSTDGAVDIIKKYSPWLKHWVSEPDRGQAHAINKGLEHCSGEIFQFINSDDSLTVSCLYIVATEFGEADTFAGGVIHYDGEGETLFHNDGLTPKRLVARRCVFRQPGVWHLRDRVVDIGGFDESYQFVFDKEFVVRFLYRFPKVAYTTFPLVRFRLHEKSKTVSQDEYFEIEHRKMIIAFARNPRMRKISSLCDRIERRNDWMDHISRVRELHHPPYFRAAILLREMLLDPRVRLSRYTLGAVRRILQNYDE